MPEYKFFQSAIIQNMLKRILYIWSLRHPASGYVQGFNDLCVPFFIVYFNDKFSDLKIEQLLNTDNE